MVPRQRFPGSTSAWRKDLLSWDTGWLVRKEFYTPRGKEPGVELWLVDRVQKKPPDNQGQNPKSKRRAACSLGGLGTISVMVTVSCGQEWEEVGRPYHAFSPLVRDPASLFGLYHQVQVPSKKPKTPPSVS